MTSTYPGTAYDYSDNNNTDDVSITAPYPSADIHSDTDTDTNKHNKKHNNKIQIKKNIASTAAYKDDNNNNSNNSDLNKVKKVIENSDYYGTGIGGVTEEVVTNTIAYDVYGDSDSNSDFEVDFQLKKNELQNLMDNNYDDDDDDGMYMYIYIYVCVCVCVCVCVIYICSYK